MARWSVLSPVLNLFVTTKEVLKLVVKLCWYYGIQLAMKLPKLPRVGKKKWESVASD